MKQRDSKFGMEANPNFIVMIIVVEFLLEITSL